MAPQFSSFVADDEDEDQESNGLPKAAETPFRSFAPDEEKRPSVARRFSDAVGQTIQTAITPLPKHQPVNLPSSQEVEDAARTFEGRPSVELTKPIEKPKEKEKPKEVKSEELKPAASHEEKKKEEGYGHSKVGEFIQSAIGSGIDYYNKHPKIGEFLFGRSEIDGHKVVGPGFQEIPGVRRGASALADIIDPKDRESSYGRGLAAGSLQGLGDVLSTGTDPRTVGTSSLFQRKPPGDFFYSEPGEPPANRLLTSGEAPPEPPPVRPQKLLPPGEPEIPAELSATRAEHLTPDLMAPGEESFFNAKKIEDIAAPKEQTLFERARAKAGMTDLPDELARPRKSAEESSRILGDESSTGMKSFEPEVVTPNEPSFSVDQDKWIFNKLVTKAQNEGLTDAEAAQFDTLKNRPEVNTPTKPSFVNPFEKPSTPQGENPNEPQFQRVEGKIGPYKDVKPDKLVDLVSKGRKPSAILENLAPREMESLVARAKELGLHVTDNPLVENEPIISKDAKTGERLARSLEEGDHETTGHLLGYSRADIDKFSEGMKQFNSFEPEEDEVQMARSGEPPFKSDNLFEGSEGRGLSKTKSFDEQWNESIEEAKKVGLDPAKYTNLDQLQWDITRKAAQETIRTGVNPIAKTEKPEFARSEKGGIKIGQNIRRAAKELTTGYSQPLEAIMVREGMQNAIDAVRHLDTKGSIHIKMQNNGFELTDSGKGMNREQLETVFSDLHESGKVSETGASGGKGVGKASYMLGGKHFTVQTVTEVPSSGLFGTNLGSKKKMMLTARGTPEDFSEHVDVEEKEVPSNTPTGTKITVQFDEGQDRYTANGMLINIHKYSRGIKSKMSAEKYGMTKEAPFHTGEGDQVIAEQKLLGNDVKIIVPSDEEKKTRGFLYVRVLNNGMYQFTSNIYLSDEVDHMPESVIADIHPTAEEGTKEYPFPTSRDNLKDDINKELRSLIEDSLINPMRKGKQQKLEELYASMTPLSINTHRDAFLFDPGKRMTQQELEFFQNSEVIDKFVGELDSLIEDVLKKTDNPLWEDRLERVGLVLDPGMHGVHIPNPSTGKSAILINPFIYLDIVDPEQAGFNTSVTILHEIAHIGTETPFMADDLSPEEVSDPRVGKYLESYLQQAMTQGGLNPGHGVAFLKRLGLVYSKAGVGRFFNAADSFAETFQGTNPGSLNPETEKLLQIYNESRGREATTEDLLSGTGDKQAASKRGSGGVPPNDKSNGKGTLASAVKKLLAGLEEARGLRQEQEGMYSKERARRFAAFEGVKETGATGAAKSLGKLSGKFERVGGVELGLSEKEVDTLFNAIKFARISTPEKARAYSALFEMLEGEVVPQRNQLKVLDDVFGDGFADRIVEMHGGIGPIGFKLAKTANTMKAMRSSIDFSAPLRQGIGLIHRPEYRKAFLEMFKYFADPEYFKQAMDDIHKDPYYLLAREAGVFLAKPGDFLQGEEAFMNTFIGSIPKITGIPLGIEASERAYTGFLNKLRFDTFKSLIIKAKKGGSEPYTTVEDEETGKTRVAPSKVAENIAKYINVSTGRGTLGRFEKIAPELNAAIWSPRLISSRLTILANPKYYTSMDPFTRREAIKTLFAIAGAGITIGGLAYLANEARGGKAKIGTDVLSADFGKTRLDSNNLVDPWAGFQQPIVATMRFITGQNATRSQTGTTTLENFSANKLSPIAKLAYDLGSSQRPWNMRQAGGDITTLGVPQYAGFKDRYGQQKYANTEIMKAFVPMFIQDVTDVMKSDADFAEQVGLDTASLFGVGIQNYPEQGAKNKIPKMNMRRLKP